MISEKQDIVTGSIPSASLECTEMGHRATNPLWWPLDNRSTLQLPLFSWKWLQTSVLILHKNSGLEIKLRWMHNSGPGGEIPWGHHTLGRRNRNLQSIWRRGQRLEKYQGRWEGSWMSAGPNATMRIAVAPRAPPPALLNSLSPPGCSLLCLYLWPWPLP